MRSPFALGLPPSHPGNSRCITAYAFFVSTVFELCYIPKIFYSVVVGKAVDMVNGVFRPLAVNMEPYHPMGKVVTAVDSENKMLSSVTPASHLRANSPASVAFVTCFLCNKTPSFWGVIEKFAYALCGKIGLSHAVVPYKQWIGQKPGSVSALAGLRHFKPQTVEAWPK